MSLLVALVGMQSAQNTDFVAWTPKLEAGEVFERTYESDIAWNEIVVSWNVRGKSTGSIRVIARPAGATRDYVLGQWNPDDKELRHSVNDQKDEFGRVETDTLVLTAPTKRVTIRIDSVKSDGSIELVTASMRSTGQGATAIGSTSEAWGIWAEVPELRQMDYPDGDVICSPTSVSMVLGYWAKFLNRPEIAQSVPEVCRGVYDKNWPGYGNWPFNTAFAGSIPGMRAYTTRLSQLVELEQWTARKWPVICSVSYDLLKGKSAPGSNDGHIVVLTGFTENGDPMFNDPGRNQVKQVYKRADFEAAWAHKQRTVYLIYPKMMVPPVAKNGNWLDSYRGLD